MPRYSPTAGSVDYGGGLLDFSWEPNLLLMDAAFEDLGYGIKSLKVPLHDSIVKVMGPSIRKNFDVGGRPPWAPLADGTVYQKGHRGYGGRPTLTATGTLRTKAGQLNQWNIDGMEGVAKLVPTLDYGDFHQTGTRSMPARIWALIQPEDEDGIQQIFEDWLDERIMRVTGAL